MKTEQDIRKCRDIFINLYQQSDHNLPATHATALNAITGLLHWILEENPTQDTYIKELMDTADKMVNPPNPIEKQNFRHQ